MPADYLSLGISAAIALGCAYGSFSRLHSARIIEDTPTSKIRSAHQGYVELIGFAKTGATELLLSGLSQTPCLWYRYNIERYESSGKNSHWRSVERKTSEQPFILNDGTGDCIVYPDRAEMMLTVPATDHQHRPAGGHPDSTGLTGTIRAAAPGLGPTERTSYNAYGWQRAKWRACLPI